ncbi:uncharacterized protein [Anoplolepis gracilipes]|uniref:uncharacterized protein isoform X1 n=1 Tax=Anoplolepis gracilipes TaxID=354296 RepID=UPI003B9ED378
MMDTYYENLYIYNGLTYNIVDLLEVHKKLKNDHIFFQTYMKNNISCLEVTGSNDLSALPESEQASNSTEEDNKYSWTINRTKLLLELYKEKKNKFRDPKKKRNLWTEILREMSKNGYTNLTEDALDRKLRNLKKTFRTIKDNNRKSSTGRGRISWEYYDTFEDIFSDDRTINFRPTISSINSTAASTSPLSLSTSTESSALTSTTSVPSMNTTVTLPLRTPSPVSARYVYNSTPIRTSTASALTRTLTNSSSDSFDSFIENPFDENINFPYSVAAGHSSESESAFGFLPASESTSKTPRKKVTQKETYDLRKKLFSVENERIEILKDLKKSIDDNNKIQQERNDLLKKLIEKM